MAKIFGVVESRLDPLKLGRCQVRIAGYHTHDKTQLKTEDLPWAIPQLPITDAGTNGIGNAPVGPVEGTYVRIEFLDEDCQIPLMVGVLAGVPQERDSIDDIADTMLFRADEQDPTTGNVLTTSDDTIVSNGVSEELIADESAPEALQPASRFSYISPSMEAFIKGYETFAPVAYADGNGHSIGWGSQRINGLPVVAGQRITIEQANKAFIEHMQTETIPYIHRNCRALLTQSMFDALCSLCYNIGGPSFAASTLLVELNSSRYLNAASRFGEWRKANGQVNAGLVTRRAAERNFFLKEGVPNDVGGITPVESPSLNDSPAVAAKNQDLTTHGFQDPKGKYPAYTKEPDTNRLARGEEIEKTVVYKKETARLKNVPIAGGSETWSQPPNPYNAQYPHNQVRQTESGHIMEFDDTPNSERIHIYHRSGSFIEWDANGTQTKRTVGDQYEILERNGHVYINGNANVTINGNSNLKINSALNVDVTGPCNINIFNDAKLNVSGSMDMSVGEVFNLRANSINMESASGDINLKSAAGMFIQSTSDTNIKAGSNLNMDGSRVDVNDGKSVGATGTSLSAPSASQTPVNPVFPELTVITRASNAAGFFETPDEGDGAQYRQDLLAKGIITQEEFDYKGKEEQSESIKDNGIMPVEPTCDIIYSMDKFSPNLQLTKRVTLGMLTKDGSRVPRAVRGLSAQEVVCNLKTLSENCLEKVLEMYPNAIITSGLRMGNSKSQHDIGQAVDVVLNGFSRQEHFDAIKELQKVIPYDQMILEFSGSRTVWIHISYKGTGNRKMLFTMNNHTRVSAMGELKLIV